MLNPVREFFTSAVYPLQLFVSSPAEAGRKLNEVSSSQVRLLAENAELRKELLLLKVKLQKFAALEQENLRLRGLMDTTFKLGELVMIAELLEVYVVSFEQVVVVNKGSRYGVYPGQPVMDANGVVGQVIRVTPYSADVI